MKRMWDLLIFQNPTSTLTSKQLVAISKKQEASAVTTRDCRGTKNLPREGARTTGQGGDGIIPHIRDWVLSPSDKLNERAAETEDH